MEGLQRNPVPNVIRDDGSLWCSSYDPDNPLGGMFDSSNCYYFRQLKANPKARSWWSFTPDYVYTGEIWEGGVDSIRDSGFRLYKKYL